jgi:DNA-binding transcriptional regulator YhcF (GntR family)
MAAIQRIGYHAHMPSTSQSLDDPLTAQVRNQLGARLGDAWRRGDRLPSVRQLAQMLGTSHGTVQRAVRDLIRNGFLVSKPRLGVYVSQRFSDAQLRLVFAQHAPSTPTTHRPLAGLRVVMAMSPEATHLAPAGQAFTAALAPTGCQVERFTYAEGPAGRRLDFPDHHAVVLFNPDTAMHVVSHPGQHVVIVSTAATLPTIEQPSFDRVSIDQDQGSELAGIHLKNKGCNEVCFLGVGTQVADGRMDFDPQGPPYLPTSQARLAGFQRGWGSPLSQTHQLYAGSYSPLSGSTVARLFAALKPRPCGVFVASDDLAVGFVTGLVALGLHLQRDYELVSFDGQLEFTQLVRGRAVSVTMPADLMGKHAADLLADRMAHPDRPRRTLLVGCLLPQDR